MNEEGAGCGAGQAAVPCSKADGASAEGICDLAGNLAEWVLDRADLNQQRVTFSRTQAPLCDRLRCSAEGVERVYRGGAFNLSGAFLRAELRTGRRDAAQVDFIGFRPRRSTPPDLER